MVIKARFDGRVFIPEQPVDLPVGSVVEIPVDPSGNGSTVPTLLQKLVEIADQYSDKPDLPTERPAVTSLERIADIAKKYPDNPDLPEDYAAQHDHYLYGTPKRP